MSLGIRNLVSRFSLFVCVGVALLILGNSVRAAEPKPTDLKSQIVSWNDAKAHKADWGQIRKYFTGQTYATKDALIAVAVVKPGKTIHETHRHADEEYLAIIEGTGVLVLKDKEVPTKRGDMLYVEPWVYHGIKNTGDKPLIFLVIRYNGKGTPVLPQPDDRPNELNK